MEIYTKAIHTFIFYIDKSLDYKSSGNAFQLCCNIPIYREYYTPFTKNIIILPQKKMQIKNKK